MMQHQEQQENPGQSNDVHVAILYLNDFHGHIEGTPYGNRMIGGLEAVATKIRRERFRLEGEDEDGRSYKTFVCLGGDIVRDRSTRLIHQGNVVEAWKHICEVLGADAFVLGNHEHLDFGDQFGPIFETMEPRGCTRNVDWVGERGAPASSCAVSHPCGKPDCLFCTAVRYSIPPCSRHTCLSSNGSSISPPLMFVGLLHHSSRNRDPEKDRLRAQRSGSRYYVLDHAECRRTLLGEHCADHASWCTDDCPRGAPDPRQRNSINIHLAHYDDTRPVDHGKEWLDPVFKHRPHFVLKGHDHFLSPNKEGSVKRTNPVEAVQSGEPPYEWVPTFEAGENGSRIGLLTLRIGSSSIGYDWKTELVGPVTKEGKSIPRHIFAPVPPDWETMISDIEYPLFGGDLSDPTLLYRAVCLLLRGMLRRYDLGNAHHVAVSSPSSIRTASYIPSLRCFPPDDAAFLKWIKDWKDGRVYDSVRNGSKTVETARGELYKAWEKKIDSWELQALYGDGEKQSVFVYAVSSIDTAKKGIIAALSNARLSKTPLPPASRAEQEPVNARSVSIRFDNNSYLLTLEGIEGGDSPQVYRLYADSDKEGGKMFRVPHEGSFDSLLEKMFDKGGPVFFSMVDFIRNCFEWKPRQERGKTGADLLSNARVKPLLRNDVLHTSGTDRPALWKEIHALIEEYKKGQKPQFWTPGA